jgi:hypothetical protein
VGFDDSSRLLCISRVRRWKRISQATRGRIGEEKWKRRYRMLMRVHRSDACAVFARGFRYVGAHARSAQLLRTEHRNGSSSLADG